MKVKDILLEAPDDIKAATYINNNVDDKEISAALRETQDSFLVKILGTNLYNRLKLLVFNAIEGNEDNIDSPENASYKELLDDYVQPYIEAKIQAVLPLPETFKTRNLGVTKASDDNVQTAGIDDIAFVQRRYNTIADHRATNLSFYLCNNQENFPELAMPDCKCGLFYPPILGKRFSNTALWLGSVKNKCGC